MVYSLCQQTFIFMKQTWLDVYLGKFKWYRKIKKRELGISINLQKTQKNSPFPQGETWWARYGKINRYSDVDYNGGLLNVFANTTIIAIAL